MHLDGDEHNGQTFIESRDNISEEAVGIDDNPRRLVANPMQDDTFDARRINTGDQSE